MENVRAVYTVPANIRIAFRFMNGVMFKKLVTAYVRLKLETGVSL